MTERPADSAWNQCQVRTAGLFIGRGQLPEGAAFVSQGPKVEDGFIIPWEVVLRDLERRGGVTPEVDVDEDEDLIAPVLSRIRWPRRTHLTLVLRASGQLARPESFKISMIWEDKGISGAAPSLRGPLVVDGAGRATALLTRAQWAGVQGAAEVRAGQEAEVRLRVEEMLQAIEAITASLDQSVLAQHGVRLDRYLVAERAMIVDAIRPEIVPVGQGFQVRPRVAGLVDEEVEGWFYERGARQTFEGSQRIRGEDGRPRNVIFTSPASRALERLKQINVVGPVTVIEILENPSEVFGEGFDLREFSPRVAGVGIIEGGTLRVASDVKVHGWFDFAHDESAQLGRPFDLRDPETARAFRDAIADASTKGLKWFQNPFPPHEFIPITAQLEAALQEATAEPDSTSPKPKVGLVLKDLDEGTADEEQQVSKLGSLVEMPVLPHGGSRLRPHQIFGVRWLLTLSQRSGRGALLADDMGLGKTLQVLSFLCALELSGRRGPHLVVAPVGLLDGWRRETDKFFPENFERQRLVQGKLSPRDALLGYANLTLVGYESLKLNELAFARVKWDVVVLDEAQKIKNPSTAIHRVACALQADFRLALTGTPVENSLLDLWSIFDWAAPGLLGTQASFESDYLATIRAASVEQQQRLATRLRDTLGGHFLRRMKHQVLGGELPRISFERHRVSLGSEQVQAYQEVLAARSRGDMKPLPALGRLLDICAHPFCEELEFSPARAQVDFPKRGELVRILEEIQRVGEKVIIFAGRRPIQRWIADTIHRHYGFWPAIINGEISSSETRTRLVDEFSRGRGFRAIVLGPRAAGVGLNITAANHVIHYTREWNPAIEAQATDRAYRMGQLREVRVHTLVATYPERGHTVDERLAELLERKQALIREFVIPMEPIEVQAEEMLS